MTPDKNAERKKKAERRKYLERRAETLDEVLGIINAAAVGYSVTRTVREIILDTVRTRFDTCQDELRKLSRAEEEPPPPATPVEGVTFERAPLVYFVVRDASKAPQIGIRILQWLMDTGVMPAVRGRVSPREFDGGFFQADAKRFGEWLVQQGASALTRTFRGWEFEPGEND